jgi:hypothetical protein
MMKRLSFVIPTLMYLDTGLESLAVSDEKLRAHRVGQYPMSFKLTPQLIQGIVVDLF